MAKKETKRAFESDTLILPAIRMVLTETEGRERSNVKDSENRKQKRPNQKTVMKIIAALNKEE